MDSQRGHMCAINVQLLPYVWPVMGLAEEQNGFAKSVYDHRPISALRSPALSTASCGPCETLKMTESLTQWGRCHNLQF